MSIGFSTGKPKFVGHAAKRSFLAPVFTFFLSVILSRPVDSLARYRRPLGGRKRRSAAPDGSRPSRERPSQSHRDRCAFIFQKSAGRIAVLSPFWARLIHPAISSGRTFVWRIAVIAESREQNFGILSLFIYISRDYLYFYFIDTIQVEVSIEMFFAFDFIYIFYVSPCVLCILERRWKIYVLLAYT